MGRNADHEAAWQCDLPLKCCKTEKNTQPQKGAREGLNTANMRETWWQIWAYKYNSYTPGTLTEGCRENMALPREGGRWNKRHK